MSEAIYTAKVGSVWIAVHSYTFHDRGRDRKQFRFSYSEHGKTKHVTASSLERIKTLAKERAELIYFGKVSQPSPTQENDFIEQCRSILGGSLEHIIPACRYYAQNVLAVTSNVTIGQSLDEYFAERKPIISKDRYDYLKRVFKSLNPNARACDMNSAYVDSLIKETKGGQRTKYDAYTAYSAWLNWCEKKGHVADATKLLNRVTVKGTKTEGKREVFTPAELKSLMESASDIMKPIFALCAFGGLRKSEALRVRWNQIDLADGFIRLEGPQVKTQTRRAVKILPTLAKWLETIPASERTGKVWNKSEKVYYYHQRVACKKAGVVWKDNGLRHSAISCRTCNGVTLSEIADWAGNSISEIKKHYLALISKSDAEQWWNILP